MTDNSTVAGSSSLVTRRENMEAYDRLPPNVRRHIANAPFSCNCVQVFLGMKEVGSIKVREWIDEAMRREIEAGKVLWSLK